jgi:anti-anti-sigma factor
MRSRRSRCGVDSSRRRGFARTAEATAIATTVSSWADGFSTTVSRDGDAILIYVAGEIDIATVERLRDAIEPHLGPQQTIILDLSGVEFMDSSCINLLVQARGTLTADGGSLFLRDPSVAAHRLVTIMGLEDLLHKDADTQRD